MHQACNNKLVKLLQTWSRLVTSLKLKSVFLITYKRMFFHVCTSLVYWVYASKKVSVWKKPPDRSSKLVRWWWWCDQLVKGLPQTYNCSWLCNTYTNGREVKTKKLKTSQLVYVLQSLISELEPPAVISFYNLVTSLLQTGHKSSVRLLALLVKMTFVCTSIVCVWINIA